MEQNGVNEICVDMGSMLDRMAERIGASIGGEGGTRAFDARALACARTKIEEASMWYAKAKKGDEHISVRIAQQSGRGYIDAHRDTELTRQSAGLDPDPTYTAAQEQLAQAERDMQYDPDPGRAERFRQRLGL